ncbi:MAG: peptide ABC transporter substrate-binding protein [Anaerolineae bacterium]|nr:peptide ABC transporter substrate-binding protein [Anaerolineae bacterium]
MQDWNDVPEFSGDEPRPARSELPRPKIKLPVRWQYLVLGAGVVLILLSGTFLLFNPRASMVQAPPSITVTTGQVYTEAIVGQPHYVNPLLATTQADRDLVSLVFSGLTRLDQYGEPVPDLAESWTVSRDGLTYTFTLRQDVTWHDGQPFTAADVDYTMGLLRDPDFPGPADLAAFWRTVEAYADDDYTVRFVLTQPVSAFPEYAGIGILPAHWLPGVSAAALPDDLFNLDPVGTGRLDWTGLSGENGYTQVTLTPYAGYYDAPRRVGLEGVELRFYEDPADAYRALGNDVLALGTLSPGELDAVLQTPLLNVHTSRLRQTGLVLLNQESEALPFFQQPEVRLALLTALDRAAIVEQAAGSSAAPADSVILPGSWAYNSTLSVPAPGPDAAAALLDGAGWGLDGAIRRREGTPLAFTLLVGDLPAERAIGEAIRDQWRDLGVDVTLQSVDQAELIERVQGDARDFDAALVVLAQGRYADPDPYPFWHETQAQAGQNYSSFVDRDISEALEIARRDPNGVRRAELYRAFQQWFLDRAAAIPLYNPLYSYAVSCQVQGVQVAIVTDPSDRYAMMHEWRIAPAEQFEQVCGVQPAAR